MKIKPKHLKKDALLALSGRWGYAISCYLIYYLLNLFLTYMFSQFTFQSQSATIKEMILNPSLYANQLLIMCLLNIVVSIIISPFQVGLTRCWLALSSNKVAPLSTIFSNPERWHIILAASSMRILILGVIASFPVISILLEFSNSSIITLLFAIAFFWVYINYSMLYFVLAENPNLSPFMALRKSRRLVKNHKINIIKLSISFIPWLFVVSLTLGIGSLFLEIYFMVTLACFYNTISKSTQIDVILT